MLPKNLPLNDDYRSHTIEGQKSFTKVQHNLKKKKKRKEEIRTYVKLLDVKKRTNLNMYYIILLPMICIHHVILLFPPLFN